MKRTNQEQMNPSNNTENIVYFKHVTSQKSQFGQPKWENVNHQEWAQGLEHGFQLGIEEVAKRMLRCGIDVSFITRITELPRHKVADLRAKIINKEDR